jgi:hypothetical protein
VPREPGTGSGNAHSGCLSWRVRDSLCISASGPVSAQYLPSDTQLAKRLHEYKVLL